MNKTNLSGDDTELTATIGSPDKRTEESPSQASAKQLAITFHNIYEKLAPDFGYKTRKETRDFDADSPNGKLMIAVCQEILQSKALEEDMSRHYGSPIGGSKPKMFHDLPAMALARTVPEHGPQNKIPEPNLSGDESNGLTCPDTKGLKTSSPSQSLNEIARKCYRKLTKAQLDGENAIDQIIIILRACKEVVVQSALNACCEHATTITQQQLEIEELRDSVVRLRRQLDETCRERDCANEDAHKYQSDYDELWDEAKADKERLVSAAEKLSRIYFEIAAKAIGEDEVRRQRDKAIAEA